MRLIFLISILASLPFTAKGLEVVLMDYDDEYYSEGEIVSYEYYENGCSCVCEGY